MNALMKGNHMIQRLFIDSSDTFFGRSIDDILANDFFNSFNTNIREEQDAYELEIAVSGMRRKNITIRMDGSIMWVSAQKQEKNASWISEEFNGKQFQRSFALPADADTNNIKAKCRNGLLSIQIRKVKARGVHRAIKVRGEESNVIPDKVTSWWSQLINKMRQYFVKKC